MHHAALDFAFDCFLTLDDRHNPIQQRLKAAASLVVDNLQISDRRQLKCLLVQIKDDLLLAKELRLLSNPSLALLARRFCALVAALRRRRS